MKKFAKWVESTKKTKQDIAKLLGCSPQRVSNLIHQGHRPSMALALRIHEASGGKVPLSSWGAK